MKSYNISMSLYKDDEWYSEKQDEWIRQEEVITNLTAWIGDYQELFSSWGNTGCNKILCMGAEEEIIGLKKELVSIFDQELTIYLSKSTYLEIMPKNSSKTAGIGVLLEKYNLDAQALMTIGDNYNDIDMIEFAGLGIAMENAPAEVKSYAKYITKSNDEDGVAWAIDKYILRQITQDKVES